MKFGGVICVADYHDLCVRHVRDFVANLSRILSQSRRNGIWALDTCRLNALLQQKLTDRPTGAANAPRLNCRFLLAIPRRTLVTALMLQLS